MAMTKVSEVTVGSGGAATIEFTNIPQSGKDLVLLASARGTNNTIQANLRFNATTTNYSGRSLEGDGAAAASYTSGTSVIPFYCISPNNSTANTFGNGMAYIANYTSSSNKSISHDAVTENNATTAYQQIVASQWANSAAITSLTLTFDANFVQHSTASLYIVS